MKKKLNNLLAFNNFDGSLPKNVQKKTKRTDVGLDILKENADLSTIDGKLQYIRGMFEEDERDIGRRCIEEVFDVIESYHTDEL